MRAGLFSIGDFTLASGEQSNWKIDCDFLNFDEWKALAVMLVERLPGPFFDVMGVPTGGELFAKALLPYVDDQAEHLLVVDDVWTTGGSMQRFIDVHVQRTRTWPLYRAVAFARNPTPPGVVALFTMDVSA